MTRKDDDYALVLQEFGISPTAAKVYLALLDLGKASADGIAKKIGGYKANVYDALDRLAEAGLASFIIEERKKLYFPTNPAMLEDVAEERKEKALEDCKELKHEIERIMPFLSSRFESSKQKEVYEIYKGRKAFRGLIIDILKEKPAYWKGFGNLQVQEFFPIDFNKWFKNTKFTLFANKTPEVLHRLEEAAKTTVVEIKWLPEALPITTVWTLFG